VYSIVRRRGRTGNRIKKKKLGDKSTLYMKTDRVSQNSGYKHGWNKWIQWDEYMNTGEKEWSINIGKLSQGTEHKAPWET